MFRIYRVHQFAKDFDLPNQVVLDKLKNQFSNDKGLQSSLEETELDFLIDVITKEYAVDNFCDYLNFDVYHKSAKSLKHAISPSIWEFANLSSKDIEDMKSFSFYDKNSNYLSSHNNPLIFVSYAHSDKELLEPYFNALKKANINIWYDDNIIPGSEWEEEIIKKLSSAYGFLFFVTEASLSSANCKDELYQARQKNKKFINILIEDIDLSKPEYEWFDFRYSRFQRIMAYELDVNQTIDRICIGLNSNK